MPHVIATERPTLWAVTKNNTTLAAGLMEVGGLTVTGNDKTLVSDADENAFLGKVAGAAGDYKPLPSAGEMLEAGAIYGYGGGLVIVRQAHTRTQHAPGDVPALFSVYRVGATEPLAWVANEKVLVGTRRSYGGKLWEALQVHTTQYAPPLVPALWKEAVEGSSPQPWQQPTGGHDAYKKGYRVTYDGFTWESTIDANVWAPGVYGWVKV